MDLRIRSASLKVFVPQPVAPLSLKRLRGLVLQAALFSLGIAAMAQSAHYGGQADATATQLASPQSLAVDGLGNVFVSNGTAATGSPIGVYKVEAVNGRVSGGSALIQITTNYGSLAVDAKNNLYVAVQSSHTIYQFAAIAGEVTESSSSNIVSSADFTAPTALAVDSDGYVIVVDQGKYVYRLAANDSSNTRLGSGYFYGDSVASVAVDGANNVYVADATEGAVYEIEAVNGEVTGSSSVWDIAWPNGTLTAVAADTKGDVFFGVNPTAGTGQVQEIPVGGSNPEVVFSSYSTSSNPVALATGLHGEIYVADTGTGSGLNSQVRIILATPPDFGKVPTGQASNAVLPFTFDSTTMLASTFVSVLGQGVGGQEFTYQAESSTTYCQAGQTYQPGQSCLIAVQFAPTNPGLRLGAAELVDANGNIFASVPLAGTGVASQLSYLTLTTPTNLYSQNSGQPAGVAVDSDGNVYYTDADYGLIFRLFGGKQPPSPFANSYSYGCPDAMTFDGAGNLFVADYCDHTVWVVQAGSSGSFASNPPVNELSNNFSEPWGVAVDGAGNLFVTDANSSGVGSVFEVVADSNGHVFSNSTVVQIATGFNQPQGLARDANGDLFLADTHNQAVKEIVAVNGQVSPTSQVVTVGSGFLFPTSVAVDAAGNVYVTDDDSGTNSMVKVILASNGAVSSTSQVLTLTNGLIQPWGITVDTNGNLFFTNQTYASVQELPLGTEPTQITFNTTTPVGSLDTGDDPQSLTLANIGNAARNFDSAVAIQGGDFLFDGATTCSQSGAYTLNPGSSCMLAVDFQPSASGPLTDTLSLGDNALPLISLSGNGANEPMLSVPPTYNFGTVQAGQTHSTLLAVSNAGNALMQLNSSAFVAHTSGAADFTVGTGGSCQAGFYINPGDNCTVEIDYAPAIGFYGNESAVFTFSSNGGTKSVTVSGVALTSLTQPVLVASTTTLDFGAAIIGAEAWKWDRGVPLTQLTLTLTNEGAGTLEFTDLTTSTGVEDFYWQAERGPGVSGGTCTSTQHNFTSQLTTGQSCTIQYNFLPWLNGARQGNLHIGSNSVSGDLNVTLKGTGVLPAGVLAVIPQQGASFRGGGKVATIDPNLHKVFALSGGYFTEVDTNTLAYNSLSLGSQESPNELALNATTGTIYGGGNGGFFSINEAAGTWNFTPELYEYFYDIAVNPATNKAYLTDYGSNIGIVDGAAGDTYSAIKTSGATYLFQTSSVAVDSPNNLAYVLDSFNGRIAVVSGGTLQTPYITGLPTQGSLLTFNPVSNKLYTNGSNSTPLTVIDGVTHAVSSIAGIHTTAVTVNPVTNRVYATNFPAVWSGWNQTATIAVIDGSSQAVLANVPVGQASAGADAIAVDTVSNEVYVSNGDDEGVSNSVSVIDGATNTVSATVPTDYDPGAIVVDEANHHAFVLNERLLPQGNPTGSIFILESPKAAGQTLPPAISAAFGASIIGVNGSTTLSFTLDNPNSGGTLSGVAFQALLPSGLQAAAGATVVCDGALITDSNGTITLAGAMIAPSGQCTVSLTVTGTAASTYTVTTGAVTAWPSLTGNTASSSLTVSSSPIVGGTVTAYGKPLAGVSITYQADTTAYQSSTAVTDNNGNYYFIVSTGWSGTITPSLIGYTFTPTSNWIPAVTTGATQNFTAVITSPEVVTASTIGSASTTIASGGTVADEGGAPVTARGVCYSTGANPTITASCTSDGSGSGAFASTLTGLQLNTSYHVRAYATSAAGTFYGFDLQFTTMSPSASSVAGAYAYISGGLSNTVTVIDTASQLVLGTIVLNPVGPTWYGDLCPYGVANSSTSGKIYVASMCTNTIPAIDAGTLSVADYIQVPTTTGGSTMAAVTSLDGSLVYVSDDSGSGPSAGNIHVINTSNDSISSFQIGKGSYGLKLHPDGNHLYATNTGDNTVTVVDLTSNAVTATITTGQEPFGMVVNNAGTRAYAANYGDNTVSVIDVTAGSPTLNTVLQTISVGNVPMDVAVSADGSRLYVSNYNDHTVSVFNTAGDANALIGTISLPHAPKGLAVQPGTEYLWVLLADASEAVIVNTAGDANTIVNTIAVSGKPGQLGSFFSTVATATTGKHTPIINWAAPATILYGTALDSTQLNATASYGGSPVDGTFTYAPAAGTVLNAGANQTLSVTFTPTDTNDYNTANGSVSLTVNKATPTVNWTAPAAITYGTALGSTQLNATASFNGSTVQGTLAYTPAAGTVLNAGANQTLSVTFTPTDTNDYNTANGSVSLTVNMATPTVNWTAPAAITYGTALGSTQLNATANYNGSTVAGTFAYTPAAGTVLNAGANQTLSVTYTPTDTIDFTTSTATVQLTVNKATPTVNWTGPAAITYGTALGSTQLNATANYNGSTVAGTFAYTPAAGTVLNAGANQTLFVTYTPSDTIDFTTSTATVQLTVNKATPTVNWTGPAAITYGTALGSTQLNATASFNGSTVQGTLAYTPAAGTVLNAGANQTLSVNFTPTDTNDYNTANGSVSLTVSAATPTVTVTPGATSITIVQALSVTVAVSGATGGLTPSGSVTLTGGSYTSPALALTGGNAAINIPAGTLPAGIYSFKASYTPDSNSSPDYSGASGTAPTTVAVKNPQPAIVGQLPAFSSAGGSTFTLTVTGTGFVSGSTVYWDTTALATTFEGSEQLTAQVPAADISNAGTASITVQTPSPGGGASNALQFEVDSGGASTRPTFTVVSDSVTPGSSASYPVTLPSSATSVSVMCLNLPSRATCSYSATTGTLTIATSPTTPSGTYLIVVVFTETLRGPASSWIFLPILLLPLATMRRKLAKQQLWLMVLLVVALTAAATTVGCGGSSQTHTVTSSGTVTLIVQ
jgi:YVTN family beta-propeller protein